MGKGEPFYRWCVGRPEESDKCQMLATNSAMLENVRKSRGVSCASFCVLTGKAGKGVTTRDLGLGRLRYSPDQYGRWSRNSQPKNTVAWRKSCICLSLTFHFVLLSFCNQIDRGMLMLQNCPKETLCLQSFLGCLSGLQRWHQRGPCKFFSAWDAPKREGVARRRFRNTYMNYRYVEIAEIIVYI